MQQLLQISRLIDAFNEWVGRLTYWLVLLMIAIGTWNVAGRYIGYFVGQNLSSNAFIEGQWYLFDLVFLLGAAYALRHDEHVRVDVFHKSWSPKWKALADLIGTLLFLIPFCLMVIYFSWGTILNSWAIQEMSPDPGGLPRYPIKSMIIVSFVLLILQGISQGIKNWAIFTGYLTPQEEHHDAGL
ncbi:MAG: TRAP transporter small permease subunit [Coleofasciculus sp. A1-SPW-01]|uniref:TRAP transporter small permease subunit n=1 Tax=Coleofasciculus sp. A1-SPW-01 TaxID=3070819 RepID=UPI0033024BFA